MADPRLFVGQTVEVLVDRRVTRGTITMIGSVLVRISHEDRPATWRHPHEVYDELTPSLDGPGGAS